MVEDIKNLSPRPDVPVVEETQKEITMTDSPEKVSMKPKVVKKPRRGKKVWLILGLVLLLVIGGLGVVGLATYTQVKRLKTVGLELAAAGTQLKTNLENQDFSAFFVGVEALGEPLADLRDQYTGLRFWKPVPWFGQFYRDGEYFLTAGEEAYQALLVATRALEPYQDILMTDDESDEEQEQEAMTVEERLVMILDTLDLLEPQFDELITHLEAAKTAVDQVDSARYPETLFGYEVKSRVQQVQSLVDDTARSVTEVRPLVSYLKPLLGIPEEKVYFLLFQNDAELRPGGGFMTAYAYISVKNGKFTPLSSHDIYALDAQFGNRLPAPESIQEYLPNVNYWHLRDMNLSPDFAESMTVFWENYEKIPGAREVDGIISVDTQVLVDILEVLGPIGVSGWGNFSAEIDERCNCPQVVYELEVFADQPVSAVRENRKGIIGPLMHSILGNMMGSPRQKWPEFLSIFFENIEGKHVMFYFFDDQLQSAIDKMNAAGRIRETEGDYFYLVDCNFGGAKSNLFITQTVTQTVTPEVDGRWLKEVVVEYRNPFPGSNCNLETGGLCLNSFYRNWFRLYVPLGSELVELSGSEVEAKTYEELGKTVFEGFYGFTPNSSLKPEGKLTLTFKYLLPAETVADKTYSILVQKQPGAKDHQYSIQTSNQLEEFTLEADTQLELAL